MNASWSKELRSLDGVAPSRDLWAEARARAASPRPPARRNPLGLSRIRVSRRRALVLAATALGIAAVAAAGVVAFGSGSARAAYAVTTNPDGSVTITLRQFSALPALNRELARDGLPLRAVPVTAQCAFNPRPTLPRGFIPFVASDQGSTAGLRPTDTIRIGTSGLSGEGAVEMLGVSKITSGGLELMAAGTLSTAPACMNSAAFYSPEVRVTPLPVSRGERETLVAWVRPRPVRRCTISVWDRNGITHAQGLYPKRLVHGRVSWTWTVAAKTNLGKHRVIVNCGSAGALRTLFTVTN